MRSVQLSENIFNNKKKLIFVSILISLLLIPFSSYFLQFIAIIFLLYLCYSYKENFIIGLIIVGYLIFTSEFYEQYRTYIQLFSTLLLIFLFLREYGLDIKNYLKFSKEVWLFVLLLFTMLIVSTNFSYSYYTSFFITIRMMVFLFISYLFYALLKNEQNIFNYLYAIIAVVIIWGIRILIDLYNLGLQDYFKKILVRDVFNLQSSISYGSYTIFYISLTLLTSMFFMKKFNSKIWKISLFILSIFNILLLILAHSRGVILAAILSISFLFLILRTKKFLKTVLISSIVITIIFFAFPNLQDAVNTYSRDYSLNQRDAYWKTGLEIINDYPLFGLGSGMFDKYFYSYASSTHINFFKNPGVVAGRPHPHNFFIYFMAENGILGIITALVFFTLFFFIAYKAISITKHINRDYYILSIAIMGIGIGEIFRSFFEITGHLTYGLITTDLPFWLLFVIIIYFAQTYKTQIQS